MPVFMVDNKELFIYCINIWEVDYHLITRHQPDVGVDSYDTIMTSHTFVGQKTQACKPNKHNSISWTDNRI